MSDCKLVVVGTSSGGLHALTTIAASLPPDFPRGVVVAQHRHRASGDESLVDYLAARCNLLVTEAEDKAEIEAGHLYLAPADYHVLVEPGWLALSTDPPVGHSRPSIDVLFES